MKRLLLLITTLAALASCTPSATSGGSGSLAAPTDITLRTATTYSLILEWKPVNGATGYEWKLLSGEKTVKTGAPKGTNAIISELSAGTSYDFQVRATAGETVSDWSAAQTFQTISSGGNEPDPDPDPDPDPHTGGEDDEKISEELYASFLIPAAEEEDGLARAFPGAEGGGMYATGGRGGKVIHVTNLKDSGAGSLRAALNESGKRTIVFDVAGIIELNSTLTISKTRGDVTIAGQTAPGDGICLKNYPLEIAASNVVVRFIRCRMGDEKATDNDAITIMSHEDDAYSGIIIDHCSVSWSTDECASFYGMKDFTFQWNIVSESLRASIHEKGVHGYGGIWGGNNASYHHNLLAHHERRNPRIDHDWVSTQKGPVTIVNNVVYNWTNLTCYGGESANNTNTYRKYNFFNNYYKPGPATPEEKVRFLAPTTSCDFCTRLGTGPIVPGHFYMTGNLMDGKSAMSADNWTGSTGDATLQAKIKESRPFASDPFTLHTAEQAFSSVLQYAGSSLSRDPVDERIADETRNGSYHYEGSNQNPKDSKGKAVAKSVKGIIDTPSDVGGWPELSDKGETITDTDLDGMPDAFEEAFGLDKTKDDSAAFNLDIHGRYTNLEMYLHYRVRNIVAGQNKNGTYTDLHY